MLLDLLDSPMPWKLLQQFAFRHLEQFTMHVALVVASLHIVREPLAVASVAKVALQLSEGLSFWSGARALPFFGVR